MADEQEQPNHMEPLGPAYDALQRRLIDDGAAWRAWLPSTERLEQRLDALKNQQRPAPFRASGARRSSRFRLLSPTNGADSMFRGRLRVALAVVSLAAIVALFVMLFHGFAGGHTTTQTGTSSKGTPPPNIIPPSLFTPLATLAHQPVPPLIAPSTPEVVYELRTTSAGQLVLARTDDAGKSWKTFPLPAGKASDQFPPTIFLSPVDAQSVFLTVTGSRVGTGCQVSTLTADSTLSGGQDVCALQYVSKDGGTHWSQVQIPGGGIVGDTAILDEAISQFMGNNVLRPQGSRLYAVWGPYSQENQLEGEAGGRLVESNDGGSSWQFIDNGLSQNGYICDIAPAPTGSTVFAITSSITCSAGGGETLTLWRSDDAGASWSQVGTLPGNTDEGMVVVQGSTGAPLLYINMPTLMGGGSTLPRSGVGGGPASPAAIQVSADGGKTWQAAPTQGLPTGSADPGGVPQGILTDGSLLYAFAGLQNKTATVTFYAWKSGDASWHKVTPAFSGNVQSIQVTTADGKQAIWLTTSQGTTQTGLTYSVEVYQL